MPLTKSGGAVTVMPQDLRDQRRAARDRAVKTIPVITEFTDLPVGNTGMVATGQQTCPGRRTHGGRVKPVVTDPGLGDPSQVGSMHQSTVGIRQSSPCVINQNHQDIRRICRDFESTLIAPAVLRILHGYPRFTRRRNWRKRENILGDTELLVHVMEEDHDKASNN